MKIGVDIGGTHICIGIIDKDKIVDKIEQKTNETDITKFIIANAKNYIKKYNIEMLGIGYCGVIRNGIIEKSHNLNINYSNMTEELKNKIPVPILVRNDAKCAGLAEKRYGAMKYYDDCVLLTIGTGIGGAYFYRGKLVEPKKSSGFELGHMRIAKNGQKCNCGNSGCFEQYASITALKKEVKKALNINKEITGIELKEIIEENINKLQEVLDEYVENLAIGISNIINILEPEIVVLGGSFSYYKDIFLERVIKRVKIFNNKIPEIKIADLKNDAGLIGATIQNEI